MLGLGACAAPGEDEVDSGTTEPPAEVDPMVVPTEAGALLQWLEAEPYLDWPGESAIHDSAGPHFGNVRTWVHPDLEASLAAGDAQHPSGAAAVKELYGDGEVRLGWAVEVKLEDDSAGGDNWYWYELYEGGVLADGNGVGVCTGCHGGGQDYVLTPFPLQ